MSGEKVAIKKIANAFENLTDARRTLREIKLLRHLRHENIIGVRDILRPPSREKFADVYLVYELMVRGVGGRDVGAGRGGGGGRGRGGAEGNAHKLRAATSLRP